MGNEKLLTMTTREFDRVKVIEQVIERRLTAVAAAQQLQLTSRQIGRLVKRYRDGGPQGLASKLRGKRSNRAHTECFKKRVLKLYQDNYADFGPTLAAEKLQERHSCVVCVETLRCWLMEAGIWQSRRAQRQRIYQPRYRRDCFGELIQIDGSDHAWFEDRAPKCCLLVYIDDATSRVVELRFCPSESTLDYMHSTRRYIERYGKPVAFYSDKHSVFRVNKRDAKKGTGLTQFGRALNDLNIDIIYANSSQAKGRVERMNLTLQDRLVKELRLEGINTIEDGNAFLLQYMEIINDKFAKAPLKTTDLHRPFKISEDLQERERSRFVGHVKFLDGLSEKDRERALSDYIGNHREQPLMAYVYDTMIKVGFPYKMDEDSKLLMLCGISIVNCIAAAKLAD